MNRLEAFAKRMGWKYMDLASCHEVCRELGLGYDLSAPVDPKTDKLIKRFNRVTEQLRRMKSEIALAKQINSIAAEPDVKGLKRMDMIYQKKLKDVYKITKELGWTQKKE